MRAAGPMVFNLSGDARARAMQSERAPDRSIRSFGSQLGSDGVTRLSAYNTVDGSVSYDFGHIKLCQSRGGIVARDEPLLGNMGYPEWSWFLRLPVVPRAQTATRRLG